VSIHRDRRLQENEDESRRIKEELISLHEAMLRHENALNALAIERTNLESLPDEERIEISPVLQESLQSLKTVKSRSIWPKVAVGILVLAGILLGLSGLGIFKNDGSTSIAQRVVPAPVPVSAPSLAKGIEAPVVTSSSIPQPTNTNSTSGNINGAPHAAPMNILPGITYTSEISYSMKSSAMTLVEVQDTPQITLHVTHAPQSFFIPMRTPFRIDRDGKDTVGTLTVLAYSKKHGLEIRFEPSKLPMERKILGVSSSQ
jgi:hypothetical protein